MIDVFTVALEAVADTVTVWAVADEEAVAANWAEVAFAGTVMDDGTERIEALLDSDTCSPVEPAATVSVTVQVED